MARKSSNSVVPATSSVVTTSAKQTSEAKSLMKRFLKATGNEYGAIAEDGLSSDITQWTDTGCLLWNMQMSADFFKGIPAGKVTGFAGPSGTMKTYACISVIDNFQRNNPNSFVFIFDSENAITKQRLKERGIDLGKVMHFPVQSLPDFKNQCYKLLKEINSDPESKNNKYLLILDSLGNLPSARELKNVDEGNDAGDMGTRSKDIRSIFRIITVMLGKNQIPMLVTNHTYANTTGYGGGQIMGGGGGLVFAADIIVMFTKAQHKEGEERVGSIITSTLDKGRDSKEKTKVKMLLHYQYGLHKTFGLLEWAVQAKLIGHEGNKYIVNGEKYSEKQIYINSDQVFTDEMLKKLNEYMKPYFSYGGLIDNAEANPDLELKDAPELDVEEVGQIEHKEEET
jgi:RecA/RadA recombinase